MKLRTVRRLRFWGPIVSAACLLVIVGIEYVRPWAFQRIYAAEYKRLVLECDQAMHDEVAVRDSHASSGKEQLLRTSSDVGLLVCHDYDKLRKKLLIAGVSEYQLALLGIDVLESERIPVSRMVEPHRMPRF